MLLRLRIGKWLAHRRLRKGDLGSIARLLGVTVRALLNWRRVAGQPLKRQGRPPHSQKAWDKALRAVEKVLRVQGARIGWRCADQLLPQVPTRLIQRALRRLKADHQRRLRRRLEKQRVHYHYTHQGVVMAQDSAYVGQCLCEKVWAEVHKDPATCYTEVTGDGNDATGVSVLEYLRSLEKEGELPLVFQTDNGGAYRHEGLRAWLRTHQVVHLRSRPYTPQDNPFVESAIGEAKAEIPLEYAHCVIGKGVEFRSPWEGVDMLAQLVDRVNQFRPRPGYGGKTACQLCEEVPSWKKSVRRWEFYNAARKAIRRATLGLNGRKARTAEREAIFRTMERYGLLVRTRGDGS